MRVPQGAEALVFRRIYLAFPVGGGGQDGSWLTIERMTEEDFSVTLIAPLGAINEPCL